ncbi:hypothetical protein LR48_Vigan05g123000 [Vigna angularis]|uniref:Uncharacterized protein n=1 Tax=Phaseolus angularis TaxID=3914 RepID=A0A0L9UL52_PHAAN|nr:hypothetical protein LR48_Vigan05g123000 [Vigna angularis]
MLCCLPVLYLWFISRETGDALNSLYPMDELLQYIIDYKDTVNDYPRENWILYRKSITEDVRPTRLERTIVQAEEDARFEEDARPDDVRRGRSSRFQWTLVEDDGESALPLSDPPKGTETFLNYCEKLIRQMKNVMTKTCDG